MTLVDQVADGLADEVIGNRETREAVVGEELPLLTEVFGIGGGIDVEVVAPAGEFEAVVAHFFGERREFFEREIGPLAGEEGDGSGHDDLEG